MHAKSLRPLGCKLVGLSIAGLAVALVVLGASRLVGSATEDSEQGYSEEEWMRLFEEWKKFVEAKENGVITEDEGEWKNVCYIDDDHVQYTYDNISLADIPEEKKRWFAFEGSMPYDERQLFLTRYYLFMTDGERNALRKTICSPDFQARYFSMSDEERKAVWNSIIWNKTIPGFSSEKSGTPAQPGKPREEKMLSEWLREAKLLSEHDYTQDGKIDNWEYDTNGDSVTDLWINAREEGIYKITRWEKDRNYDGKADWQFEEMFRPFESRKHVKSIVEDTNYDGVFDYSAFLEGRRKITYMQSYDTDGDGRYDRVVHYKRDGSIKSETRYYFLAEIARENNGSTDPCGFNYCETDLDMDGKIDIFRVWVFGERGPAYWEHVNQSLLDMTS